MIETFVALLSAHVLADFVLQPGWMASAKRRPGPLLLHGAIVLITAQAATGQIARPEILALALAHVVIDAIKARLPGHAGPFLLDQAAHLATLVLCAAAAPDLMAAGLWHAFPYLPALMILLSGAIVATRTGQFAVELLMKRYRARVRTQGLPDGGRLIGVLERGLIFALILLGQPVGVGFLVAAKSILRFGTASRDQRTAEYVIIGTLASFGWAILTAYATLAILGHLAPLPL